MNLTSHIRRQREWSAQTFGPAFRRGTIDHLLKEVEEIRGKPDDLEEWIDALILSMDGAWRAGFEPAEISADIDRWRSAHGYLLADGSPINALAFRASMLTHRPIELTVWACCAAIAIIGAMRAGFDEAQILVALENKQTKNENRVWPDWRTASPHKAIEHDRSLDVEPVAMMDPSDD